MKIDSKKLRNFLKPHLIGYFLIRNSWMLHFWRSTKNISIKDPIFFLGCQGDGLTFISRIIRRNKNIITCSGNSNYWAGADEMATVYEPFLTPNLRSSGWFTKDKVYHKLFKSPRSWTYANDDLLDKYRLKKMNCRKKTVTDF